MANKIGPEVDIDDFKSGVNFIKDSLNEGNANFYFESQKAGIKFKKPPAKNLITDYGINYDNIKKIANEIIEIVSIILSNEIEDVILNIGDNEEVKETFKQRCDIIEREIINWKLIKRYHLQTYYKTSLLDKFDWDIIIKSKKLKKNILTFPTAMLRIRTRKPFSDSPPVMKTKTITLETGTDEIDYLIQELTKIRDELSEEEEKWGD